MQRSITQIRRIVGTVVFGVFVSFAPQASADLIGDQDCWSLAGSCPDGSLWRDGLGGVFFTDYRSAGEVATAPFTDIWAIGDAIAYTHTGTAGDSLVLRIAGVADTPRGPWDVFGDGVLLGVIPEIFGANAFQEVLTYTFAVPGALLADNLLDVLLNTNVPDAGDGFAIDYSQLGRSISVPEPMTLALFGTGLAGIAALRRRRKAKI